MRSRWKKRARKFILKNILRLPLSFLVKTRFEMSYSSHDARTKLFHNEEFTFDSDVLLYQLKTGTRGESNVHTINSKNDSVRKEYDAFISKLIQDGFFEAVDNVHFEYEGMPKINYSHSYHLYFLWTFNEKLFQS